MAAGPADDELAGQVVDAHGAPVPDALITIVAGTVSLPEIALMADAEGRFTLRLPDGRFTLRAHGSAGTGDAEVERPRDATVVIAIG
jgi:hypothetical protein